MIYGVGLMGINPDSLDNPIQPVMRARLQATNTSRYRVSQDLLGTRFFIGKVTWKQDGTDVVFYFINSSAFNSKQRLYQAMGTTSSKSAATGVWNKLHYCFKHQVNRTCDTVITSREHWPLCGVCLRYSSTEKWSYKLCSRNWKWY